MVMREHQNYFPIIYKSATYKEAIILHMPGKTIDIKILLLLVTFHNKKPLYFYIL